MGSKKTAWVRMLKILAVLIPAALFVLLLPVSDSDDTFRVRGFYLEEPDSLDVVILGASDVYAGYSPVLAYEEYGFTSYPYVVSGNFIELFQGQLEAVLQTQSPELIVIDIAEAIHDKGPDYDMVFRDYIAGVPLSRFKMELIWEMGDKEDLLSYYLPFSLYHGNADLPALKANAETGAMLRSRGYSLLKGALTFTGTGENWDGAYVEPISTAGDCSTADIPPNIEAGFMQFLSYCREKGLENLLFVNFPHRVSTEELYRRYQIANSVGELIEEYGYDFINLDTLSGEIGLVPEADFYQNEHMNLYGQYKTTRFLCDILVEDYGLEGRGLSPENKERWDACVEFSHRYYHLFESEVQAKAPDDLGKYLKEEAWLVRELEAMP